MSQTEEVLSAAVQMHRGGQIQEAWQLYQRVLQDSPRHPVALNAAGLLLRQAGRFADAAQYCRMAVEADPTEAAYHANLGESYRGLGQLPQGIACYEEAVRLAPEEFAVHFHLGALRAEAGMPEAAVACYQRALALRPHAAAYHALGSAYQSQGRLNDAADCFRSALALEPDNEQALCDLASVFGGQGRCDEAIELLLGAVTKHPGFASCRCNLGTALLERGQVDDARKCFEEAVALEPMHAGFRYNLATTLLALGRHAESVAQFDRALECQPDYPEAQYARATVLLAQGDFLAGWAGHESRLHCPNDKLPSFSQPLWDGGPLAGRTLLVQCEQGFGDTFQFIRYAQVLHRRGERVIVAAPAAIVPLLIGSGLPHVVPSGGPLPPFDVYVPLLSLPHRFQTTLDEVPRDVPYLAVDAARIAKWRDILRAYDGLKVGLVWQGRRELRGDRMRSIPPECFAPLAEVPGVRLFSLQKDAGREQLSALAERFDVVDLAISFDADGTAFMDVAAAMRNLDLMITSDTGPAHLAGALGVPIWVALSAASDWRWMTGRDDSPWYPSMRLFRQSTFGQWSDVFERMARELALRPPGGH